MLLRGRAGALRELSAKDPLSIAAAGADPGSSRRNGSGRSPMSSFPPPSIGATISACPTDSTSTTGWPTTGSEWRVWTCRNLCRQGHPPTHRESRSSLPIDGPSRTREASQGPDHDQRRFIAIMTHVSHHRAARAGRTLRQHAALPGRRRRAEGQFRAPRSASGFGGHGLRTLGSLAQVQTE